MHSAQAARGVRAGRDASHNEETRTGAYAHARLMAERGENRIERVEPAVRLSVRRPRQSHCREQFKMGDGTGRLCHRRFHR